MRILSSMLIFFIATVVVAQQHLPMARIQVERGGQLSTLKVRNPLKPGGMRKQAKIRTWSLRTENPGMPPG
jgi:hypothetical protein